MGWATGSEVCGEIVSVLKRRKVPKVLREKLYEDLVQIFRAYDCDTLCEVDDRAFQKAYDRVLGIEEAEAEEDAVFD